MSSLLLDSCHGGFTISPRIGSRLRYKANFISLVHTLLYLDVYRHFSRGRHGWRDSCL